MRARVCGLVCLLACGAPPAPAVSPPPAAPVLDAGAALTQVALPALPDGQLEATLRPLATRVSALLARCDASAAAPIRDAGGEVAPPEVTPALLRRDCLEAPALRAELAALYVHSRDAMLMGNIVARIDDDAWVLAERLDRGEQGAPLASAAEHLGRSVREERPRAEQLAARDRYLDEATRLPFTGLEGLAGILAGDRVDLGHLVDYHLNYAVRQRGNPHFVRRSLLAHFAARAAAVLAWRRAQVAAAERRWGGEATRAHAEAVAALDAYVQAYLSGVRAAAAGWPADGPGEATPLHEALQARRDAWHTALGAFADQ